MKCQQRPMSAWKIEQEIRNKLKLQQKWGENKKGCKIQGGKNEIFTFLVCCVVVSVWVSLCVKATKKVIKLLYSKQQLKNEILKPIKFKDELLKGIKQKCDLFAIRKSKPNKQNTKWQKIQLIVWVVCASRHQSLIKFDLFVSLIFFTPLLCYCCFVPIRSSHVCTSYSTIQHKIRTSSWTLLLLHLLRSPLRGYRLLRFLPQIRIRRCPSHTVSCI